MRTPTRVLTVILAVFASFTYVWVAAVRAVPGVRRRKAAARRRPLRGARRSR